MCQVSVPVSAASPGIFLSTQIYFYSIVRITDRPHFGHFIMMLSFSVFTFLSVAFDRQSTGASHIRPWLQAGHFIGFTFRFFALNCVV